MTAYTLKQAGELLQAKKISAVELAQEYLAAIDARNPAINGYITLDKDKTLAEKDYRKLILEEYTFLKRPVVIINDKILIGSDKKNVEALKQALK